MKKLLHSFPPDVVPGLDTEDLRSVFTANGLFEKGEIQLSYWDEDRTLIGGAVPTGEPLTLPAPDVIGEDHFCARRELGVLNLGGAGSITVDGDRKPMEQFDGLYIGRGTREVVFASDDAGKPARFYLLSYPAHQAHPTTHIPRSSVEPLELGSQETSNERKLYKVIHPGTCKSCQLVMGYTRLSTGSVWNTMPAHTHIRRSEVYLYFDMADDAFVVHLMGQPDETRHIIMRNFEVVLSPSWSIHSGAGTGRYSFVWGMGGENQEFTDMQGVDMKDLY